MQLQVLVDTTKTMLSVEELKKILGNKEAANLLEKFDPWMLGIIIIITLAALILSLLMVYLYVNRIQTDELRRKVLVEKLYKSIVNDIMIERNIVEPGYWEGPEYYEQQRRDKELQKEEVQGYIYQIKNKEKELSHKDIDEIKQYENELHFIDVELNNRLSNKVILDIREKWENLNKEYKVKVKEIEEIAKKEANSLIPRTATVTGMKITGSFFIELTAILTIIFGIIILGLIGVLESSEIAPILAAIAGYVLGKTTGWAPTGSKNNEQETNTQSIETVETDTGN